MSIFDRLKQKKDAQDATAEKADTGAKKSTAKKTEKKSEKKAEKKTSTKKAAEKKAEKKASAKKVAAKKATSLSKQGYNVLVQPVITEKAAMTGTYVFEVHPRATKSEIAKAVQAEYGVKPKTVRTMNVNGKAVRWGYRQGKRKNWKKAIIRLEDGQSINVYEGI